MSNLSDLNLKQASKGIAIIGSGPSLCEQDIKLLKNTDIFCFNRSFLIFNKWDLSPKFYGCFDPLTSEDISDEIEEFVLRQTNAIIYINSKSKNHYSQAKNSRMNFIDLNMQHFTASTDSVADLGSSGAISIQIAIALGYKKILLLGMDANYNLDFNASDHNNHFTPEYCKGLRLRKYNDLSEMFDGWRQVAEACKGLNIECINCTQKSLLPFFKNVELTQGIKWLQQ